jgi:hypothetical protein
MVVSSISVWVVAYPNPGFYKPFFASSYPITYYYLFIACILLVKKAVTRTSKTLIAAILLKTESLYVELANDI